MKDNNGLTTDTLLTIMAEYARINRKQREELDEMRSELAELETRVSDMEEALSDEEGNTRGTITLSIRDDDRGDSPSSGYHFSGDLCGSPCSIDIRGNSASWEEVVMEIYNTISKLKTQGLLS